MPTVVKKNLVRSDTDTYRSIENSDGLRNVVDMAFKEREIAVDLEADSMHHFRERVCLIQMAFKDRIFIIDPLTIRDMSPLKALFYDAKIKKVLHGVDYDVRSLYRDFDIDIRHLFDTQIACRFLGMQETELDTVLKKRFNLTLNKKYRKKDWSTRPLPETMIAYAAGDVSYLLPLANQLEKELSDLKRLSWVREESALLSKVRPPNENNEPLFWKSSAPADFDLEGWRSSKHCSGSDGKLQSVKTARCLKYSETMRYLTLPRHARSHSGGSKERGR